MRHPVSRALGQIRRGKPLSRHVDDEGVVHTAWQLLSRYCFICGECELGFDTAKGLHIHIGQRKHESTHRGLDVFRRWCSDCSELCVMPHTCSKQTSSSEADALPQEAASAASESVAQMPTHVSQQMSAPAVPDPAAIASPPHSTEIHVKFQEHASQPNDAVLGRIEVGAAAPQIADEHVRPPESTDGHTPRSAPPTFDCGTYDDFDLSELTQDELAQLTQTQAGLAGVGAQVEDDGTGVGDDGAKVAGGGAGVGSGGAGVAGGQLSVPAVANTVCTLRCISSDTEDNGDDSAYDAGSDSDAYLCEQDERAVVIEILNGSLAVLDISESGGSPMSDPQSSDYDGPSSGNSSDGGLVAPAHSATPSVTLPRPIIAALSDDSAWPVPITSHIHVAGGEHFHCPPDTPAGVGLSLLKAQASLSGRSKCTDAVLEELAQTMLTAGQYVKDVNVKALAQAARQRITGCKSGRFAVRTSVPSGSGLPAHMQKVDHRRIASIVSAWNGQGLINEVTLPIPAPQFNSAGQRVFRAAATGDAAIGAQFAFEHWQRRTAAETGYDHGIEHRLMLLTVFPDGFKPRAHAPDVNVVHVAPLWHTKSGCAVTPWAHMPECLPASYVTKLKSSAVRLEAQQSLVDDLNATFVVGVQMMVGGRLMVVHPLVCYITADYKDGSRFVNANECVWSAHPCKFCSVTKANQHVLPEGGIPVDWERGDKVTAELRSASGRLLRTLQKQMRGPRKVVRSTVNTAHAAELSTVSQRCGLTPGAIYVPPSSSLILPPAVTYTTAAVLCPLHWFNQGIVAGFFSRLLRCVKQNNAARAALQRLLPSMPTSPCGIQEGVAAPLDGTQQYTGRQ